jgi:hypothetical protein
MPIPVGSIEALIEAMELGPPEAKFLDPDARSNVVPRHRLYPEPMDEDQRRLQDTWNELGRLSAMQEIDPGIKAPSPEGHFPLKGLPEAEGYDYYDAPEPAFPDTYLNEKMDALPPGRLRDAYNYYAVEADQGQQVIQELLNEFLQRNPY